MIIECRYGGKNVLSSDEKKFFTIKIKSATAFDLFVMKPIPLRWNLLGAWKINFFKKNLICRHQAHSSTARGKYLSIENFTTFFFKFVLIQTWQRI